MRILRGYMKSLLTVIHADYPQRFAGMGLGACHEQHACAHMNSSGNTDLVDEYTPADSNILDRARMLELLTICMSLQAGPANGGSSLRLQID